MLNRLKNSSVYSVSRRVQCTAYTFTIHLYYYTYIYRAYLHNIIIAAVFRRPFTYFVLVMQRAYDNLRFHRFIYIFIIYAHIPVDMNDSRNSIYSRRARHSRLSVKESRPFFCFARSFAIIIGTYTSCIRTSRFSFFHKVMQNVFIENPVWIRS